MRNSIFISYRRADSSGYTQALFAELRRRFGDDRIFLDVSDIHGGDDFVDVIEAAGYQARVLLVVIGTEWLGATDNEGNRRLENPNDYVRREIVTALKHKVRVIPVLVNGAEFPKKEFLPEELQPLARRNAIEVRHSRFDDDVRNLSQTLEAVADIHALQGPRRIRLFGHAFAFPKLAHAILTALGVVVLVAIYVTLRISSSDPRPFAALEKQGYVTNAGFSGHFLPGNIIKTTELRPDGKEAALAKPLVLMWANQCFPGKSPKKSEFLLSMTESSSADRFRIGSESIAHVLPALDVSGSNVGRYSITFDDTHIETFALADLSREFSPACVETLSDAIDAGDRPEFFAVIVEAVMATGLSLEIDWESDISASAKLNATKRASEIISSTVGPAIETPRVGVGLDSGHKNSTTLSAEGTVIVAYRYRPVQPVFDTGDR